MALNVYRFDPDTGTQIHSLTLGAGAGLRASHLGAGKFIVRNSQTLYTLTMDETNITADNVVTLQGLGADNQIWGFDVQRDWDSTGEDPDQSIGGLIYVLIRDPD